MANTNIPLPTLDWSNENKQEAFSEWLDFMTSYFTINNVEERLKYNYILPSTRPKSRELIKNALLTTEQREFRKRIQNFLSKHDSTTK